jgi:hypothetical protein
MDPGSDTATNQYLQKTKSTNVTKSDADTDLPATTSATNEAMFERKTTIMMTATARIGIAGATGPAVRPQNLDTAAGATRTSTVHHAPIETGAEIEVESTVAVTDRDRIL